MPVLGNIKAAVSKVAGPVRAKASAVGGVLKQKAARVGGPESGGMPSAETKLTASVGQIEKHAKRAAGARDTMQQAAGVTLPDRPTGASFPPNTGGSVFEALATDPKLANSSSPDVPSGWPAAQSGDVSPTNADFARVAADPQVRTAINTGETVLHTPGSQTSTSEANSSVATATKPPDLIPRVDPKSPLGQAIERSVQDIAAREPIKQQELANAKAVIRGEASPPKMVSFDEQLKANQQRATQETAQQQGAQQSAEGAQTSTSTPAKPEAKAGGTTDQKPGATSEPTPAEKKAEFIQQIAELDKRLKTLDKKDADYDEKRAKLIEKRAAAQRQIAYIDNPELKIIDLRKKLSEAQTEYAKARNYDQKIQAYEQMQNIRSEIVDAGAEGKKPQEIVSDAKKEVERIKTERLKGQRGGREQIDRMMSLLQNDPDAMKRLAYTKDADTSHDKKMAKFLRRVREQNLAPHGMKEWIGTSLQAVFANKAYRKALAQRELLAAQEQLRALTAGPEEMANMQEKYPKDLPLILKIFLFFALILGKQAIDTFQDANQANMQQPNGQ